jgi:hypothetical protein
MNTPPLRGPDRRLPVGDPGHTRLITDNGRVQHSSDEQLALVVTYGLPRRMRVAFRSQGDRALVYPWHSVPGL